MTNNYQTLSLCGSKISFLTDDKGLLHSENEPSLIIEDSDYLYSYYYLHGFLSNRKDEPSYSRLKKSVNELVFHYHEQTAFSVAIGIINLKEMLLHYTKDGTLYSLREDFLRNTLIGRKNGPAIIIKTKSSSHHGYYQKNELHREDGPASIWFNEKGEISSQEWFIEGRDINEKNK